MDGSYFSAAPVDSLSPWSTARSFRQSGATQTKWLQPDSTKDAKRSIVNISEGMQRGHATSARDGIWKYAGLIDLFTKVALCKLNYANWQRQEWQGVDHECL